jgi:glycerol-3-phosphate acyltransferase PlsY
MLALCAAALCGYLLGSFPTSVALGRWLRGIDVREAGSRNPGAANVLRLMGWRAALVVLLVDAGKGWLAVEAGLRILPAPSALAVEWLGLAAGSGALAGHLWPLFAGLRGGKGVATSAGAILALAPAAAGACALVFFAGAGATRRVSVGSMAAAAALPFVLLALHLGGAGAVSLRLVAFGGLVALTVLLAHRANLRRLLEGREPRISQLE